jgi:hypothetical protein
MIKTRDFKKFKNLFQDWIGGSILKILKMKVLF